MFNKTSLRDGNVLAQTETPKLLPPTSIKAVDVAKLELAQRAQEALGKSPIHSHRFIDVAHDGARLILRGRVSSFYHKQLAQEVVRGLAGGVEIINSLEVIST